jgi:flagellar biogenesis protein FliO
MVSSPLEAVVSQTVVLMAQIEGKSGQSLDPKDRARMLVAVTSLALLCVFLVALAWVMLRMVRRYVDRSSQAIRSVEKPRLTTDDWADRPLFPNAEELGDPK